METSGPSMTAMEEIQMQEAVGAVEVVEVEILATLLEQVAQVSSNMDEVWEVEWEEK